MVLFQYKAPRLVKKSPTATSSVGAERYGTGSHGVNNRQSRYSGTLYSLQMSLLILNTFSAVIKKCLFFNLKSSLMS